MYKIKEVSLKVEGTDVTSIGIFDEKEMICDLPVKTDIAKKTVKLLNDNEVERCHVFDIVEDMFYGE